MAFQSFPFLAFLGLTLLLCLPAGWKNPPLGRTLLTLCSLLFYCWGFTGNALLSFCVLLLGGCLSGWVVRRMASGAPRRRALFIGAVVYHIGVLALFKYTGFFTGGAVVPPFAPLGLSFFTFQQLWLLKEAYTGQFSAGATRGAFTLYAFFFPCVSSGPILRPGSFFSQLEGGKFLRPTWDDAAAGVYALVIGCAKKVVVADSLGIVVNNGYANLPGLNTLSAALVILGYSLQLYFDFSGYCDMATGMARLLGIRLPVNFNSPYRALCVGDFWKRWHITLTTFLRECLYFPLGGNKKGAFRSYCNIFVVFLLSGLWHGAGWTFLLWGALHGLGQIVERLLGAKLEKIPKFLRWLGTFSFVNLAWVYFRAPSVAAGNALVSALFSFEFAKTEEWLLAGLFAAERDAMDVLLPSLAPLMGPLLLGGLFSTAFLAALWPRNTIQRVEDFSPSLWRGVVVCLLGLWSVLSFSGITGFIYSNF